MRNQASLNIVKLLMAAVAVVVIFATAAFLRLGGLDWDEGTHLHPDERYLTMVVSTVRFPAEVHQESGAPLCDGALSCLQIYWDTEVSPLNPTHYDQFANYVYGTLPLFTTRAVARWVDRACQQPPAQLPRLAAHAILGQPQLCTPGFYTGYAGIHLVGRALSAFADLATLVALILLAKILYGSRTALMAGALYAFAVLPIQHAHFFVVDSFATVFVIWTLVFCVASLRSRRLWLLLPAGLLSGLAIASKVSVWPLALVVGLAGFVRPDDAEPKGAYGGSRRWRVVFTSASVAALAGAGFLAAVAFRCMQPYAFTGPGFWGLRLNPDWIATMKDIQQLMQGLRDVPFGHQWTARAPIIFPWRNMVVWGLGIPLGLAAWIGWLVVGVDMLLRRRWWHLVPWIWATGFFAYQATQWVKSMRYLLPVYPMFALFAGWIVTQGIDRLKPPLEGQGRHLQAPRAWRGVLVRLLGVLAPAIVLLGAVGWAWAFTAIYRRPVTRIVASEWIYQHVPTAVTLETATDQTVNVPLRPNTVLSSDDSVIDLRVLAPRDLSVTAIVLPKADAMSVGGVRTLVATLATTVSEQTFMLADQGSRQVRFALNEPVVLEEGDSVILSLSLVEGAPVKLKTSIIANEHWDDGLPLPIGGRDPYGDWYQGLQTSPTSQMNNYDADELDKRTSLLAWLEEADYIVLSSNRLYASIPRLPKRYPLTTEYYRLLLGGELGFDLVGEFVSFPTLAGCQFPDQEIPFPLDAPAYTNAESCTVRLPPAEEAFSVYDHPTVLVFAKSPDYSRARTEELLPRSLTFNTEFMTPREATQRRGPEPNSLLMTPRMRQEQESGGTWSELFNREGVQNRYQWIGVIMWALMLSVLGWMAFPLLYVALPSLRYRGYGLARILGLLIWSYVAWLLASLHVLPFTRTTLWVVFVALAGLSLWVAYSRRRRLGAFVRGNWRSLLTIDAIFLVLYLVWVGIRALNPDLWHPVSGGEKPMDFAYLNAVIKSSWFPPYDPWFAGGQINYYYFGFVMVASLIKALGIVPSIAYNLAVPAFFAMTGVGAYTLANNLAGGDDRRGHRAGLWGVALVLLLGNLGEARLLFRGLVEIGNIQFESLIPGYPQVVSALVGLWKVVIRGAQFPFRPEWWYWDATRIIPYNQGEAGPINEFPAFTFLYADLHAHMMALPLTQVALGLTLQWALGFRRRGIAHAKNGEAKGWGTRVRSLLRTALPSPLLSLGLAALVAGALRATNTWDYPTYLILMSVGFAIGLASVLGERSRDAGDTSSLNATDGEQETLEENDEGAAVGRAQHEPSRRRPVAVARLLPGLLTPVVLLLLAELLFRPFTSEYRGAYASFAFWTGSRTPPGIYLLMYGQFLFPLGLGAVVAVVRSARHHRETWTFDNLLWPTVVVMAVGVLVVLFWGYLDAPLAWLVLPFGGLALLILTDSTTSARRRLLWFWVGTAMALSLLVEVAVLEGDISRMNTVFKFHLQVWMLLGVGAAVFAERIIYVFANDSLPAERQTEGAEQRARLVDGEESWAEAPPTGGHASSVWPRWVISTSPAAFVILVVLVFIAALYPTFAIPAKLHDRWVPTAPQTLDGMAYMPYATQIERGTEIPLAPDYRVIRWLQENVEGSPTIIEAQGEREYLWGNRIATYTGLPSVIGWRWHQVQQRMVMPPGTVELRQHEVRTFYNTDDAERALRILQMYDVEYVILTPYERAYMESEGLSKFARMVADGWLEIVYQDEEATVYRVRA
ncbi:MAG: DUF2298 domain-containing protein [Anaerolineae bacterium]